MEEKNKLYFGLDEVHYSIITEENGVLKYGKPIRLFDAVGVVLTPEGEEVKFYADNKTTFASNVNQGYKGTLELAKIPDSFKVDILGFEVDQNGVITENSEAIPKKFALLFEFSGNVHKARYVLYNVSCGRPNLEGQTNTNTLAIKSQTLNITVSQGNEKRIKSKVYSDCAAYDKWFEQVYEPTAAVE